MSEHDGLISHVFNSWDSNEFESKRRALAASWTNENISDDEVRQFIALLVAHAPEVNISDK